MTKRYQNATDTSYSAPLLYVGSVIFLASVCRQQLLGKSITAVNHAEETAYK